MEHVSATIVTLPKPPAHPNALKRFNFNSDVQKLRSENDSDSSDDEDEYGKCLDKYLDNCTGYAAPVSGDKFRTFSSLIASSEGRSWVLVPDAPAKTLWDVFMVLMLLYVTAAVPGTVTGGSNCRHKCQRC